MKINVFAIITITLVIFSSCAKKQYKAIKFSQGKLAEKFEMDAAERLKRVMERNKLNKEIATRVEKKNTPKPVVVDCGKYNTPGKTLSNKCRNDPNCKLESGKNKKSKKQRRCVPI